MNNSETVKNGVYARACARAKEACESMVCVGVHARECVVGGGAKNQLNEGFLYFKHRWNQIVTSAPPNTYQVYQEEYCIQVDIIITKDRMNGQINVHATDTGETHDVHAIQKDSTNPFQAYFVWSQKGPWRNLRKQGHNL